MNNNSSNINVNINFKANTEAAKNNINSLQSLLTQITQTKNIGLDSSALGQAKASAQELQMHLENAVNVNTGKLDLGKFNASLKAAGSDLTILSANLRNVGPVGQQAFIKLARAIASAQTPMLNVSNAIAEFGKTLVNTVKWQLASNLIHGIQGALQAAVSHAKDLNSALNDIRIVTGYSTDKMSEFVSQARESAKELNTTITEYAKASLIFFQQGLTGDAVKERTDVVIKMSQVTHESAEQVSSELTAIWNNFDDGTHTLEWYADAITALGAATASSSKEIAQGLQKFAAVADTVGLSYEYATAALATVVAETRQSADIVGTSFKTIFSRLESLKLGETLEDGTDLNKYSAALLTVGVNIKKANGDLKDMDEILDELGDKWQLLGRDQQVALAQAVGGVRQYQQFIALADNWSKVQKNIEIARNSNGTLAKQQAIWSQSFEAATKRVEEAKKQLYEDLVNDNALIKLNDIFTGLLQGIGNVIKDAGGIVPIIMMIIALLSNTLMPLVKNGINRLKNNIAVLSGAAQRSLRETQDLMRSQLDSALNSSGLSKFTKEQILLTQDLIAAKQRLDVVSKNLSTAERAEAEMRYAIYEARSQELQVQLESLSKTEQEIKLIKEQVDVLQQKSQVEQALDKVNNYKYVSEGKGDITSTELSIAQSTTTESLKTKQESQLAASKKVQEEINQLLEKRRESENGLTRAEEKRLESLRFQKTAWNDALEDTKRLLAVRRELDAIEKKEVKLTVTGMDNESMKNFSSRGGDVTRDMHNSIRSSIVSSVQGKEIPETDSGPDAGSAEIQANAENLDVLAQKWGELTQIVTSAQQVMKDINTSIAEVASTDEELSQANEKVKEATDDVKKAEEALKKARKDKNKKSTLEEEKALQEARQKLTAATTRQKKAIEDNAKATKNFSSVQQQAKLAIHSLGESAGLSKDQLQQLDTSMNSIGKDTTPEQMGQILTPLIESCREAGGDVEALIQKMRLILDPENKNPEVFDNLINKAKEMGAEFARTKQEEDKVLNPTEEPIAVSKFDKVSGALTGIASNAAKVAMAYNGLKSVVNIWTDKDASIMDKIMTTFMSLTMIVPILTGAMSALKMIKDANIILDKYGTVAAYKKAVADKTLTASTKGLTVATWALNAAEIVRRALQGPKGWAILAGAAIAVGVATTALIIHTKKTQENTAAIKENQKATEEAGNVKKVLDKWEEQSQAMDGLIMKYKQLKQAADDYSEAMQGIADQVPELIKAYNETAKSLHLDGEDLKNYKKLRQEMENAAAAGDVERVQALQTEIDSLFSEPATKAMKDGAQAAANTLAAAMDEAVGGEAKVEGNKVKLAFSENSAQGEGDKAIAAFKNVFGDELTEYDKDSGWFDHSNIALELDTTDPTKMVKSYEKLQQVREKMESSMSVEDLAKSDIYLKLDKMLSDSDEAFQKAKELSDKAGSIGVTAAVDALKSEGTDLTDINSYSEYQAYRKQLMAKVTEGKTGAEADEARETAQAWLDANTNLTKYTQTERKFNYISDKFGTNIRKELEEYYASLNAEDQELFLQIDFNHAATKEAWDAQMNMLRAQAEQEDLQVKITGITTAQEKLKESGMTSADWQAIQTNVDWEAAGMSFTDFMQLSYNEQKAFLEQTKKDYEDTYNGSVAKTLKTTEEDLATLEQQATNSRDAATNYAKEIARQKAMLNDPNVDTTTKAWIGRSLAEEESILATMEEKANAAEELYKTQKEYVKSKQAEAAIQAHIVEDEARSAVMQAESLDKMYTALAHLQTVTGGTLDKNIEWDALANLGSKYDNAAQETESFKRIQAALGKAQTLKIDFADTEEGAAALSAKNQAETTYGYMQRSNAHGTDEWSEEDMQQARQARDDARQAYTDAKTSYERAQEAWSAGGIEKLEAAMREQEDILKSAILIGESADKYDLDPEAVEAQARTIRALNKEMRLSAEQAARMAIANQRMNKGINTLSDSLENWKETLKTAKKGDTDWAKIISEVEAAVKDLIGATDDFELPDDFLDAPENMKLLEKAADGDLRAINQLGNELTAASIKAMEFDITLAEAFEELTGNELTAENFENIKNSVLDGLTAIHDNLKALTDGTMTLDEALGGSADSWIKSLNDMALATGMSVEQMNAMLNQMGVQAKVTVVDVPQRMMVPTYEEHTTEVGKESFEYEYPNPTEDDPGHKDIITGTRPILKTWSVPGESMEVDGVMQVAQIATGDDPKTPEIEHMTASFTSVGGGKTGGGVGRSNTTSGKKDKSKSGSKKEKKDKKSAEKETERYHEITSLIEDYARELDKASKAKDRAFGPQKLKAMQAEIAAQAQLNAATEEHIREIREWLEIDKARIAAQGATFDEYGNISNYTDLMQQHIDAYNAAVAAYNASGQSDSDKEAMEAAEKAYQDFMDQLSQYEETNDLLQDKLDELIEAQQAKYDKEFEMLQYTIEFKIEADDSILSYLDYMKNKIENFNDGVHDAVEMLATLNDEAATLMDKNSTYNRAIDDTLNHYLSNQGMGESDIQAFIDRFKSNNMSESDMSMLEDMTETEYQYLLELKNNLLEINNSLIENMNAVVETVQNSFSKTAEDLDKATRPIERAASALENYAAIIDIVGRDALGITDAIAAELDNAAVAVAHSATVAAKAKVDTLQSERDEVQRLYNEAMAQGLTEMAYKWKTVLEEMDDEIAAATDDFNSKWQEELTKAREAFENTVERIKQSMLDAFAGSIGSWSGLKDSLEYAKTAADRFVPQYKEIYELSKLNRDIMKSIDNTSNIKNKQALRDLQKEINELEQHSGEISQYDLDNARRRYELELARLQLEEARDAKSTVRLSKDAEGNWSYVYTANQEDVEKAEQNYEDKLYAMQQANNEYINSLSDQILELEEQYAEKLAEIRLDNTMSEEERNAAIERLNAYFAEQMEYLTNEGQKAVDNNARLFEEEWTTYHNWTDAFGNDVQARIDNQHDFMTQFGDTILGTYTGYGNFDELNAAMVQIAEEASVKMEEAYGALQAQVATAMEAAGIDVAHFGEVVHDTVNDQIVPSAQAAEDAVVEMGKAAADEFKELTDGVSTWQTKYATEMQKIINKNEQLATSVNNLATAYANLVAQMYAAADAPAPKVPKFGHGVADGYINDDSDSSESGDFDDEGGGGATTPNWVRRQSRQKPPKDAAYKSYHETLWHDINGVKSDEWRDERHLWTGSPGIGGYSSATCDYCGMQVDLDPKKPYAIDDKGHILIPGYDTGGYTGNWNSSQGKLAVLHEKELVLNKDDTKNILGTVEMVRKLSQKIDLNAQTARYAFNYHPIINDPKPIDRELQVDQTVSITAEFPNVQNRTEIEEAFTTLINQASQFANRKS